MFILGILLHETGHLFGGLLAGYRFLHIEMFGFSLEKINGRYRFMHYRHTPIGQCLMYPCDLKKNGYSLILGGIAMNLIASSLFFVLCILLSVFWIKLFFLISSIVNLSLALMNIFGSETSDGRTFLEVKNKSVNMKSYNILMLITKYLREGRSYQDMPEDLFSEDDYTESREDGLEKKADSIKRELDIHRNRYLIESGRKSYVSDKDRLFGTSIGDILKKYDRLAEKSAYDEKKVFLEIAEQGKGSMYPGEYLSAARCFILSQRNKKKVHKSI